MSAIDKLELSKLLAKLENKSLDFASVLACMLVIAITLIVINVFSELLTVLFYPW